MRDFLPRRGAIARPLIMEVVRQITDDDVLRLGSGVASGQGRNVSIRPALKQIRAIHHRMAQLLSQGRSNGEVAVLVGRTPQSVSDLQQDPAFKNLLSYYTDQFMVAMMEDSVRLGVKANNVGEMALDELTARFEDDASRKNMTVADLTRAGAFGLDRGALPPKAAGGQAVVPANITLNFGTELKPKPEITIDNPPQEDKS